MECEILGWPPAGPAIDLDHERFAYAGKFVMTRTGKAVVRDGGDPVAAVAFDRDRTDDRALWVRTLTVARDRQGEGLAPRLLGVLREGAFARGYDRLRIAVATPYAYQAAAKAGFWYAGRTTGIREAVLECGPDVADTPARYRAGLEALAANRDLPPDQAAYVADRLRLGPPR